MLASARATIAFRAGDVVDSCYGAVDRLYRRKDDGRTRAAECGARLVPTACSNNIVLDDFEGVIDLLAVVPSQMQAFADKPRYSAKVRNLLVGVPRLRGRCVGAFAMRI